MIKKAILLGLAAVSAWQFIGAVNRYMAAHGTRKADHKEAINTWENEGGNPAPARPRAEQRA